MYSALCTNLREVSWLRAYMRSCDLSVQSIGSAEELEANTPPDLGLLLHALAYEIYRDTGKYAPNGISV
jgi:hypothetical protein